MIETFDTVIQRIAVTGREDVNVVKREGDEGILFWGARANTYAPIIINNIIQLFGTTKVGTRKNFCICKSREWSEANALPTSACHLTVAAPLGWTSEEATSLSFTLDFGAGIPSVELVLYKAAGLPSYMEVDVTVTGREMQKLYVKIGESMDLWAYFTINAGVEENEGKFYVKSLGGRDADKSYGVQSVTHYASTSSLLTAATVTNTSPALHITGYYNKFGASDVKPTVAIDIGACNTSDAYLVQTDAVARPISTSLFGNNAVYNNYPTF